MALDGFGCFAVFLFPLLGRPRVNSLNVDLATAALGDHGAVFASQKDGETPATIFYRPIKTWAGNAEWTLQVGAPFLAVFPL